MTQDERQEILNAAKAVRAARMEIINNAQISSQGALVALLEQTERDLRRLLGQD